MVIEKTEAGSTNYEKLKSWPENFIAFGDSVSAFNPFYAQGITKN